MQLLFNSYNICLSTLEISLILAYNIILMERIRITPPDSSSAEPDIIIAGKEIDLLRSKEIEFRGKFGLVVVSSKPGGGSSSLARSQNQKYNTILFTAGDVVRALSGTQERAPGFIERDAQIDRGVDDRVRQMVIHANKNNPAIAEAQIGCLTALDAQREIESYGIFIDAPILRILLWARKDVRDRRLYEAARNRGEHISLSRIRERTSARERGDLVYWKSLYPDLIGNDDPLEKGAKDARGEYIYDIEIDNTEDTSPESTFNEVHKRLMRIGLVVPILTSTPQPGIDYIGDGSGGENTENRDNPTELF